MGASSSSEAVGSVPAGQGGEGSKPMALVVCGPSGVGKGTLINKLMADSDKFGFSVSHTTRAPRPGEKHGVNYYFTTKEQFAKEIAEGRFLEHAEVHGNIYGTSFAAVDSVLQSGKVCVLDIDVQGARTVRRAASKLRAAFVFILPPSLEALEARLRGRGTETEDKVQLRLANAKAELMSAHDPGLYDCFIVNDDLEAAYQQLQQVASAAAVGQAPQPPPQPPSLPWLQPVPGAATAASGAGAAGSAAAGAASSSGRDAAPAGPPAAPAIMAGMQRWAGKVALVTGASSGIGWAVCVALAAAGMKVVAVARRKERLEALQALVSGQQVAMGLPPGALLLPVVADISKEAEVAALPRIILKRWPDAGIDVCVNVAGLSRNDASLMGGNTASWAEMVGTNLMGLAMVQREAVQDMKRRGRYGHIINLTGLSGHRIPDGPAGGGFFAATKHAVRAMTEGLRQEARGAKLPLRVTGISPGLVETEFFKVRAFGDEAAAKAVVSQMRCLQPEDIAQAVMWALSAPDHVEVDDIIVRPTDQLI